MNKNDEGRQCCLIPGFRKKAFSFSPLSRYQLWDIHKFLLSYYERFTRIFFSQPRIQHLAKISIKSESRINTFSNLYVSEHLHHINLFIGSCLKMYCSKTKIQSNQKEDEGYKNSSIQFRSTIKEISRMT